MMSSKPRGRVASLVPGVIWFRRRVGRLFGGRLVDGRVGRFAISRIGGGKDEAADLVLDHRVESVDRFGNAVGIVLGRLLYRFADLDERSEVERGVEGLGGEQRAERVPVRQISNHEFVPQHNNAMARREIVESNDIAALPQ